MSYLPLNISISYFHVLHFFDVNSLYVILYPFFSLHLLWWSIIDLLFQLMFVFIYRWNIFLWHISIVCKYLKWKNHIDPFIRNEMIIGSPHIISSQSLHFDVWLSCDAFFLCQFIVCCFIPLYLHPSCLMIDYWPFVSIDICLCLLMEYVFMTYCCRE